MIELLYELLAKIGYHHPLHPALTHVPVGGVMVAFLLMFAGVLFKRQNWMRSAHHVAVVAWALVLPTVVMGVFDWQHYYAGIWFGIIKTKMLLAASLFTLLLITIVVARSLPARAVPTLILLSLCLLNVMGLGYFGGELVFADKTAKLPENSQLGQQVFLHNCVSCHVNGGNIIYPSLPLRTSPKLQSYQSFIAFVRQPTLRNGLPGPMPVFSENKLSEQDAQQLYHYIVTELAAHKKHS